MAFAAGTSEPKGIVVFSGTGAGAAVINDGAIVQRADGYGWLVGDEGSAVWLGKEAVRAALAAYDGRGSPTLLTDSVPRALLGATVVAEIDSERRRSFPRRALAMAAPLRRHRAPPCCRNPPRSPPEGLPGQGHGHRRAGPRVRLSAVRPLSRAGRRAHRPARATGPSRVRPAQPAHRPSDHQGGVRPPAGGPGRLGPVVAAAAAAGDPVARRITDEAAQWLLRDVDAVRPALSDPCAPVVMHGSVLREGPVAEAVRTGLRARFAEAPRSAGDGAVGAAGMALRRLGHPCPAEPPPPAADDSSGSGPAVPIRPGRQVHRDGPHQIRNSLRSRGPS
ncbi:ATPase [Actinomadura madurae]|uniref:BadF/BadG/BcrA/BcrD ATPase family protein n=1 Tax=Actinomadura madurae TaxID=1993 RepID=UPI0020D233D7|nr:BadF/BadG/BcrA/BcrD ATPase family protein [Actinomadura madurae]MCP9967283.1 ATPase [Actinomadura madurae]